MYKRLFFLLILPLLFYICSCQLLKLITLQQNKLLVENEELVNKIIHLINGLDNNDLTSQSVISQLEELSSQSSTDPMGIASYNLGIIYKSSKYNVKDWNKYKQYIVKASMRGSFYAYIDLAFMLENKWIQDVKLLNEFMKEEPAIVQDEYVGFHPNVDLNSVAMMYYKSAAMNGHPLAQMILGYRYDQGYKVKQSCQSAAYWYEKAAESALDDLRSTHISLLPYEGKLKVSDKKDVIYRYKMRNVLDYYKYTSKKDGGESLLILGYAYLYGIRDIPKSPNHALQIFQKAVQKGEYAAYSPLGKMYAYGIGVNQDNKTALSYYRKGVQYGDPESMNGLGVMYLKGQGVIQDSEYAFKLFNQSASANIPEAQYNLGLLHLTGEGVTKNLRKAFEYMSQSAQQGFPLAQFYVGRMYLNGWGVAKSCQTSVRFLKHVAERGYSAPLLNIAHRKFSDGLKDEALLLYHQIAVTGDEYGVENAAYLYDKKIGTTKIFENGVTEEGRSNLTASDYANACAFSLYHEASKAGVVNAMIKIGDYYYYGKGTHVDYEQSVFSYKLSLIKNSARGAFNLGYAYEYGIGVEKSYDTAKRYYQMAIQFDSNAYIPAKLALINLHLRRFYRYFTTRLFRENANPSEIHTKNEKIAPSEIKQTIQGKNRGVMNSAGELWELMRRNEALSISILIVIFVSLVLMRGYIEERQRIQRNRRWQEIRANQHED